MFVSAALLGCLGCATVAPYERETLARPDMSLADDPERDAPLEEVFEAREGASGRGDGDGGGCGCN